MSQPTRHRFSPDRPHRRDARAALRALADELVHRGLRDLYLCGLPTIGVLSVSAELTIWCYLSGGLILRWRQQGAIVTWPAADPQGAAIRLAAITTTSPRID